jgi:hypothetical protein
MHIVLIAGLRIDVQPGVKAIGVEDFLSLAFVLGHFDHIHDFDWHSSSWLLKILFTTKDTKGSCKGAASCAPASSLRTLRLNYSSSYDRGRDESRPYMPFVPFVVKSLLRYGITTHCVAVKSRYRAA